MMGNYCCHGKEETLLDREYLRRYHETQKHVLDKFGYECANNDDYVHALLLFNLVIKFGNKRIIEKLACILFPIGIDEDNIMVTFQSLIQIECIEQMLTHNDLSMNVFENILDIWTATIFDQQTYSQRILNYILEDDYTQLKYQEHCQQKMRFSPSDSMYIFWFMNNTQFQEEYRSKRIGVICDDIMKLRDDLKNTNRK